MPALLAEIGRLGLGFEGFHIFSGSQNLRAEAICEAQRKAFELAVGARGARAAGRCGPSTSAAASAFRTSPASSRSISRRSARTSRALAAEAQARCPGATLVIELGRYLVGEAGIYVCRVIDRKVSRGQVFLVTDGGLHHHLAASGNFGQVIRKNYPVVIGNRVRGARREIASVVGPLCTPLDLLADRMELAEAHPGRPRRRVPVGRLRPHREPARRSSGIRRRPRFWFEGGQKVKLC